MGFGAAVPDTANMLFNSYIFLFLFLPIVVTGFLVLGRAGRRRAAVGWLVLGSLFFYGWWNPRYLSLILGSILFNYAVGLRLTRGGRGGRPLLIFGIATNLALLGYFKYANFFVRNLNCLVGTDLHLPPIILPLAISFFTFQQITYLVDSYLGETREYNFLHYCLFVTFFPQLIAGPIVHHREMLPQFAKSSIYRLGRERLAIGLTIFFFGLCRKVVIADSLAHYATPVFNLALEGGAPTFLEAWGGVLAYSFQLYFDFSGYSEMAVGLGYLIGIRLPMNFNSPYKATSIIDFWRRWHITLSRFLLAYVYIPMGGSRRGAIRRYANLMITMLLGGLWHGAGWTFVLWGALHGFYLVLNHAWRGLRRRLNFQPGHSLIGRIVSRGFTFFFVVLAWVFFRAESLEASIILLRSLLGRGGIALDPRMVGPLRSVLADWGIQFHGAFANGLAEWEDGILWLLGTALVVWLTPNTLRLFGRFNPALETYRGDEDRGVRRWLSWNPSVAWALVTAGVAILSIIKMSSISEFLYYQF